LTRGIWALVFIFVLSLSGAGRATEVFLDIQRSGFQRIPVAILKFQNSIEEEVLQQIDSVLRQDLEFSEVFDLRDADGLGSPKDGPDNASLAQAAKVGVQGIVWGHLSRRGEELMLEAYVYETAKGQQIVATRIVGGARSVRGMAHRLADKMVFAFTGEKGIAESRIAYVSDIGGSKEAYVMDYDGAGQMHVTADRSILISPRWSPNGKQLVYTSYRGGNPDIYLLSLETGVRKRLVSFPNLNISAAFSPNGDRIAFASSREGNAEIYAIDPSGRNLKRLTFNPGDDLSPSWSPAGTQIAFTSDRGGTPQIYIMDSNGGNVSRLTFEGDYNTSPNWSPKGDWIAYACMNGERRIHICLITPDGQTGKLLTQGGEWDDESPSWAPNGRDLVYTSSREGKGNIYIQHLDGTGLRRLTANGGNNTSPAWSPGYSE
jgi:TolB protein